jgi:hypothetical protein
MTAGAVGVKTLLAIATLIVCGATADAVAQETTTLDPELRTAYCIPVIQYTIKTSKAMLAPLKDLWAKYPADDPARINAEEGLQSMTDSIAKLESTLNRLQLYLGPRIPHLDPVALLGAQKRGIADTEDVQKAGSRCSKQCGVSSAPPDNKAQACLSSCSDGADKDLVNRVRACQSPTWLPF